MAYNARPLPWLLLLLLLFALAQAQDGLKKTKTEFDSKIGFTQYFEDDDVVLLQTYDPTAYNYGSAKLWRSEDAGQNWKEQVEVQGVVEVILHPYDKKVAFAFTESRTYWVTHDHGKKWKRHDLPEDVVPVLMDSEIDTLSFHARDSKKVILNARHYIGRYYESKAYYSKDGLEKPNHFKELRDDTRGCSWAHEKAEFKELRGDHTSDRILCLVRGKFSKFLFAQRLMVSDDHFKTETEPTMSNGRTLQGILSVKHVKGYLVAAARAENTEELTLYASVDGLTWHRAEFPEEYKLESSYTVLESTNYSLQVAVTKSRTQSVLMSSNSNGTYFTEAIDNLHRDSVNYFVDFEKVMGFQGVILVNTADSDENVRTLISFHDGRNGSWQSLKVKDEEFHLHSVTDRDRTNPGRIYSSSAPGVLMGIGNAGDKLKPREKGDLYVSNDAGRTWAHKLEGPHKYAFGDQGNILLAIPDGELGKGWYSINHGEDWEEFTITEDPGVELLAVITTPDSTLRTFVVIGSVGTGEEAHDVLYSIDTDGLLPSTCKGGDFEDFEALQKDEECVMGHKQIYKRRRSDAKCFIRSDLKAEQPRKERCKCKAYDFECDFNYKPEHGLCVPALSSPKNDKCKKKGDTFRDESGFRLIPDNDCIREGGDELDKEIDRVCDPSSKEIEKEETPFPGAESIWDIVYLERATSSYGKDETVLAMIKVGNKFKIYISSDHGKEWKPILEDQTVIRIVPHEYDNDSVFFITNSDKIFYSTNRGRTIHYFKVEYRHNGRFTFREDNPKTFIWSGSKEEDCKFERQCRLVASYTDNGGDNQRVLKHDVKHCEFIKREGRIGSDGLPNPNATGEYIYCGVYEEETSDSKLQLLRSNDFFKTEESVFDGVLEFQTMSEFIVSASQDEDRLLFINASVSGGDFAAARFPPSFSTEHDAYTILSSETHALFLHATVSTEKGREYGRLLKSNSNGTYYVSSLDRVNRNKNAYIDFEKVQGIEGLMLANIVANREDDKQTEKSLQSRISHNDGANWAALRIPENAKDSKGQTYDCRRRETCDLHLYGYTDKLNAIRGGSRPYSSSSGVALLIGNGNVGEFLDTSGDKDAVFISSDAGISWKEVRKGRHLWAYGDQGSLIVLVEASGKTKEIHFSTDEGDKWDKYEFADEPVDVLDLTTLPSDNSKSFIVWADNGKTITSYKVDFAGTREEECKLNEKDPDKSEDYYTWSPKHPLQQEEGCLFGHVLQYHRKKVLSNCWNGPLIDSHGLHEIARECECIRQDFECDFNYEMNSNGECTLVQGFQAPDHSLQCKVNSSLVYYYEPTGYRRIPLDKCQNGLDLESRNANACPGHEQEFERINRGLTGFNFFVVAILLPVSIAGGIGYWVYRRWDGKFGAIRLGESSADTVLDIDKPWVKYPVMAVSALIAVSMAVPGIVASALRDIRSRIGRSGGRYTTRESFARSRGQYTAVTDLEDELLGEDDEEE